MNHLGLKNAAPLTSDLTLVVEIIMGLALIASMVLARRGAIAHMPGVNLPWFS